MTLHGNAGGEGSGRTLTVSVSDGVTVTSEPAGIDCGGTCSASFAGGAVTLTATHDGDGQVRWSGCEQVAGDTCEVGVTGDSQVSAGLS